MSAMNTRQAGACLRRCLNAPRVFSPQIARNAYATASYGNSSAPPQRVARSASTATSATASRPPPTPTRRYTPNSTASSSSPSSSSAPPTEAPPPDNTPTTRAPTPTVTTPTAAQPHTVRDLEEGLSDSPLDLDTSTSTDWSRSFHGLSSTPFSDAAAAALLEPLAANDIEVKPDGIIYLPEIKYRRILNRAFGPGGWGLAPRGETIVTGKTVTREYGLVAGGRLVSVARGEQQYFDPEGIPTATEGCKSNALMRCCKDLGVASELWDPRFIRKFMKEHAKKVWVEHVATKKKKQITIRKDDEIPYPWKESKFGA